MIKVAHSVKPNAHDAVEELKLQLGAVDPKVLLCFSSTNQEPHELLRLLNAAYPHALLSGASTAGEIVSGKVLKGGVVAMAIGSDVVEKAVSVVVDDLGPRMDVDTAIANLEKHFGTTMAELDPDQHVGIVITDGLSGAEERLIEAINEKTEIAFVGGSAGDDLKFDKTLVFSGKTVHERSAILLLMKVPRGFEVVKTQSFKPTGVVLEATDVDVAHRKVVSFNGKPALEAYCRATGSIPESVAESFLSYPVARMVGGEPFVRSPQRLDGNSIHFYSAIRKGESLAVMQATDIVSDTTTAVEKGIADAGGVRGMIDFHCILRAMELESKGLSQDYGAIFKDVPTIGFCTYGEAWTTHINQTSTMLLFK
jgi:hypothetical protein